MNIHSHRFSKYMPVLYMPCGTDNLLEKVDYESFSHFIENPVPFRERYATCYNCFTSARKVVADDQK